MTELALSARQAEFAQGTASSFVIACPGAGKTRAIIARYLRRAGASPRKGVALISFTNAAVTEATRRCAGNGTLLEHPHFVGTFDSFIQKLIIGPLFVNQRKVQPRFLESWDALRVTRVIPDRSRPFESFSLEWFDFTSDPPALVANRVRGRQRNSLLHVYEANAASIGALAKENRKARIDKGYISCSVAREHLLRLLNHPPARERLCRHLCARFGEIIVDEAQDCGVEEIKFLEALRQAGMTISIIGDPDQAIYEFRDALPEAVVAFGETLESKVSFTENYRSSPAICSFNRSFRVSGQADVAAGPNAEIEFPVVLLPYREIASVGALFESELISHSIQRETSIILSHALKDAATAAGSEPPNEGSGSFCYIAAHAATVLKSNATQPLARKKALEKFSRRVLDLYEDLGDGSIDEAAQALGSSKAEFFAALLRVLMALDPRAQTREDFAVRLRLHLSGLSWPGGQQIIGIGQKVKACTAELWGQLGGAGEQVVIPYGTIHSSKGLEYPAVCLLIPPSAGDGERSGIASWLAGENTEPRRVLYVGGSRAEKLLCLAVHENDCGVIRAKLSQDGVSVR